MRVVLAEQREGARVVRTLGAGRTLKEAKARARTEMIERLSGFFVGTEPCVRASRRELGEAAIDPNDVLLFSKKQILRFARDDKRRYARDDKGAWSPLLDSATGAVRFLPTELLYYRYGSSRRRSLADSNGVAAGRGFADAASRAVLELIERDSVALWWYNRVQRPRFALEHSDDPAVWRFVNWTADAGRACWALDLTSDLGIPVVAVVSMRVGASSEQILLGFGAHLDRTQALRRAMLEVGQMQALVNAARRGRIGLDAPMKAWLEEASLASHRHLLPADATPRRLVPSRRPVTEGGSTFRALSRMLARHGLHPLLLDLTRKRFRVAVARVVVPGLRPWWPRFAPGRLYDAPVAAGWQPRAKREAELNPEPVFF